MSRDEFMKRLEYLLSDVSEDEKRDALDYYRDYLAEAGDHEAEVLREFGSPERIAAIIRSDIRGDLKEGGEFADTGYRDERFREPRYQMTAGVRREETHESSGSGEPAAQNRPEEKKGMTLIKAVVIIAAVILLFPVIMSLGGSALGVAALLLGVLLGAIILVAALTLVLLVTAAAVGIYGVVLLFSDVLGGALCIGVGLIILSLGLLSLVLAVLFYGRFLPWLIRSLVDLVSKLFHRR